MIKGKAGGLHTMFSPDPESISCHLFVTHDDPYATRITRLIPVHAQGHHTPRQCSGTYRNAYIFQTFPNTPNTQDKTRSRRGKKATKVVKEWK